MLVMAVLSLGHAFRLWIWREGDPTVSLTILKLLLSCLGFSLLQDIAFLS